MKNQISAAIIIAEYFQDIADQAIPQAPQPTAAEIQADREYDLQFHQEQLFKL